MSAIIAGKSCKVCGREYWTSFGHPKWYDDVVKRKMPKSENFKRFEAMARSGMCPRCYVRKSEEEDGRETAEVKAPGTPSCN